MEQKRSLHDFLEQAILEIPDFERNNKEHLKLIIRNAIKYYHLNTYEMKENSLHTLYLWSMAEENMLSKLVELLVGTSDEARLEIIYDSAVVRKH